MGARRRIPSPRLLVHLLVIRPCLRLIFGVSARGREHLEGLERCVLAANHNSHLDTLLLYSVLPYDLLLRTRPVAAKEYFAKSKLAFGLMERLFRPVWVDRTGGGKAALDEMARSIEAGESLILFPEGSRGEAGEISTFRSGIGRLMASHPGLVVLPVFILGPERALPKQVTVPLPVMNHIVIGPPLEAAGDARNLTQALQRSIEGLARTETARRQRRRRRSNPRGAFTVAVLGIDGSGKSSLSRRLAECLSLRGEACLVSDALEMYGDGARREIQPLLKEKLRRWLSKQAKQASSLAGYKIPKLSEMMLRDRLLGESERWYDPAWLVLDGSTLLNLSAWATLYKEGEVDPEFCSDAVAFLSGRLAPERAVDLIREFPEIRLFKRVGLSRLRRPDAVVFIDLAAATAIARITSRGEEMQVHETEDKLARLGNGYRKVCDAIEEDLPVLRLAGERSLDDLTREAEAFSLKVAAAKEVEQEGTHV